MPILVWLLTAFTKVFKIIDIVIRTVAVAIVVLGIATLFGQLITIGIASVSANLIIIGLGTILYLAWVAISYLLQLLMLMTSETLIGIVKAK